MSVTDDWDRVSEIFNDAFELPPEKRPAFLERACGGDLELRRNIEKMIADEEDGAGFPPRPFFYLQETPPDEDPEIGRRIGPYEIVRRLARGGMGTVFLAERRDGEIEQRVAVKLLRPGRETNELMGRFHAERQLLARLEHPNLARLLDVGTTEDGLPYMVMELVEGRRIDEHCDHYRLSVRERVELFRQLCDAVAFVHRNGVIHRDLKPANVLVSDDGVTAPGRVKLLDFGVAKLLDDGGEDDPRQALTATRQTAPLTRLYASPEQQVADGAVSTASDVYSLGAVLYELLSGHRAHRLQSADPVEAVRVVREDAPPRPSVAAARPGEAAGEDATTTLTPEEVAARRRTEPKRLRRALAGDLDTIVLKALRKEPERRFASAAELSEELRRHLAGLPIHSRGDSLAYRTGKLVRRHPWGVTAAALIVVLTVGWTVATAFQNARIRRQNEQILALLEDVRHERDRSREATRLFVDVLGAPDPRRARGETPTLRQVLDNATVRLQAELQGEPEIRATLLDAIGVVYRSLGLREEARRPLEEALVLRREHLAATDPLLAESLHNLAALELEEKSYDKAEDLMREALAIQRTAYPEGHRDLARGLTNYALLLHRLGRAGEAEALVRESLDMKKRLFGEDDEDVATSLSLLARLLAERKEPGEAEEHYRRAVAIRRAAGKVDDPTLAVYLNNLATLLVDQLDRAAEAVPLHREALQIRRNVYAGDHAHLVSSLNNLAIALTVLGEYDEAGELFAEVTAMAGRMDGSGSPLRNLLRKNEAMLLAASGDFAVCERRTSEVLGKLKEPERIAETQSIRGACLAGLGRRDEAEPLLREGYETLRDLLGEEERRTRQARERLTAIH